ncbi:MAG TPA: transposase [Anaerolineaceae bacterium]|nr:transposase [Anaerolineaceae bacterium]
MYNPNCERGYVNIRRYYQSDQIVFITQTVENRLPLFTHPEYVSLLKQVWRKTKERYPFTMLAYVILPDHFHLLIQPNEKNNFSQILHSMKMSFTLSHKRLLKVDTPLKFWQKRFWDHIIRSEMDLENHILYTHFNPVKHGYVQDPNDWENSSFHEWQQRDVYSLQTDWSEPEQTSWGE